MFPGSSASDDGLQNEECQEDCAWTPNLHSCFCAVRKRAQMMLTPNVSEKMFLSAPSVQFYRKCSFKMSQIDLFGLLLEM